jgi:hypothetical protein
MAACARAAGPVAELYDASRKGSRGDEIQWDSTQFVEDPGSGWPEVGAYREPELIDEVLSDKAAG